MNESIPPNYKPVPRANQPEDPALQARPLKVKEKDDKIIVPFAPKWPEWQEMPCGPFLP